MRCRLRGHEHYRTRGPQHGPNTKPAIGSEGGLPLPSAHTTVRYGSVHGGSSAPLQIPELPNTKARDRVGREGYPSPSAHPGFTTVLTVPPAVDIVLPLQTRPRPTADPTFTLAVRLVRMQRLGLWSDRVRARRCRLTHESRLMATSGRRLPGSLGRLSSHDCASVGTRDHGIGPGSLVRASGRCDDPSALC